MADRKLFQYELRMKETIRRTPNTNTELNDPTMKISKSDSKTYKKYNGAGINGVRCALERWQIKNGYNTDEE